MPVLPCCKQTAAFCVGSSFRERHVPSVSAAPHFLILTWECITRSALAFQKRKSAKRTKEKKPERFPPRPERLLPVAPPGCSAQPRSPRSSRTRAPPPSLQTPPGGRLHPAGPGGCTQRPAPCPPRRAGLGWLGWAGLGSAGGCRWPQC